MKKIYLPLLAAIALASAGCGNKAQTEELGMGIRIENLDTTADRGADFYQYACGGWMNLNPLTGEYSRFGSFDKLGENNREQLRGLIEEIAANKENVMGSEAQKIGDFFNVAMDSVRLNAEGVTPIAEDLAAIDAITTKEDLEVLAAKMSDVCNPFFALYIDADIKDVTRNILQSYQAGIGMDRDYYFDGDKETIRAQYVQHIAKMFALAGMPVAQAEAASKVVMDIETRMAGGHFTNVELRDPEGNYHLMSVDRLKTDFAGFNWDGYLAQFGVADVKEISISQPKAVTTAIEVINSESLENLKLYMKWHLIDAAAGFLSDDFRAQNFEFYGKVISGKQEMTPRWKTAVSTVDGSLSMAVGRLYCEKYFPEEAKTRMEHLVQNLLTAYGERIDNLDWMSEATKAKAHEKLSTFYVKVGYPKEWRDYSTLSFDNTDSYWSIVKKVGRFNAEYMIAKLNKPVDKDEWLMSPQTVNAYYNPTTNEICFPAGILQYPFFDMTADDAFNYGAIGVVIAHEVTHGFDDQGSQFDKDGNLSNWWTEEDKANFEARTKVMEEYFDAIEVAPGLHANGAFTLGENIADHGGLQVSYQAFCNATRENPLADKEGFTAAQRFFLAYAGVWAGNIRPEEIVRRTATDPHSLGRWRVNGALPHINAWYEAFGITETDPLYLAPEKRVSIW